MKKGSAFRGIGQDKAYSSHCLIILAFSYWHKSDSHRKPLILEFFCSSVRFGVSNLGTRSNSLSICLLCPTWLQSWTTGHGLVSTSSLSITWSAATCYHCQSRDQWPCFIFHKEMFPLEYNWKRKSGSWSPRRLVRRKDGQNRFLITTLIHCATNNDLNKNTKQKMTQSSTI